MMRREYWRCRHFVGLSDERVARADERLTASVELDPRSASRKPGKAAETWMNRFSASPSLVWPPTQS